MLKSLHIHNFAIIDKLSIEVKPGFTVLTGETGAGKSIWIDALLLTLGARADNSVIATNKNRAEISATFAIAQHSPAKAWLEEHDFDADECILTRIINRDSPSKAMVNGRPVPAQLLQQIGELLLTVHTQHQYQLLLKSEWQLNLLDDFASHQPLLTTVTSYYQQWKQTIAERDQLDALGQQPDKIDWLRYQVAELEKLAISQEELVELDAEQKRLSNAEHLIQLANTALNSLSDADTAAISQLQTALHAIEQIQKKDSSVNNINELVQSAIIQVNEAQDEIQDYLANLNVDPETLQQLDQRLTAIHDAARKHRVRPEQLPTIALEMQAEIDQLETAEQKIKQLNQAIEKISNDYQKASTQLSQSRKRAAKKFSQAINEKLTLLGMQQAQFHIDFQHLGGIHKIGSDKIEFLFSANPGQAPAAMKKIASGGELSRISLAIHVISSEKSATPSLIFDEVDTGVGGKTAAAVGELLRELGQHTQVLSITHLAQVAALGQQHLKVDKQIQKNATQTRITELDQPQRIEEIARMIGGAKITDRTRQHAEELLGLVSA